MPDTPPNVRPVIALVMLVSAITLVILAVLIYTGVVPLPPEARFIATLVVVGAAFADFLVGIWFFRKPGPRHALSSVVGWKGQSS